MLQVSQVFHYVGIACLSLNERMSHLKGTSVQFPLHTTLVHNPYSTGVANPTASYLVNSHLTWSQATSWCDYMTYCCCRGGLRSYGARRMVKDLFTIQLISTGSNLTCVIQVKAGQTRRILLLQLGIDALAAFKDNYVRTRHAPLFNGSLQVCRNWTRGTTFTGMDVCK